MLDKRVCSKRLCIFCYMVLCTLFIIIIV